MINTSAEAMKRLAQAKTLTHETVQIIDNLIVQHDYQDVASLVAQAAEGLLEAAHALMESQDEAAMQALENVDDLLDAVYDIIDSETDDE